MPTPWAWQSGPPAFLETSLPDELKARKWNRPLWGPEVVFAIGTLLMPKSSDMLISCHLRPAQALQAISLEDVRKAMRLLRWQHPGIAVNVAFPPFTSMADFKAKEGRLVYRAPTGEEEVDSWLDEVVFDKTGILVSNGGDLGAALATLRRDLGAASKARETYFFKIYYLGDRATNKHAILLHIGHTISDGIGTFEALDLWLHALASVLSEEDTEYRWGEEVERLDKAMPERSSEPWIPEPVTLEHPALKAVVAAQQIPPPKFGLPILYPDATPSLTANLVRTFQAPFAENLRLAARAQGVGIFAVLVAANLLTLLNLSPPADAEGELAARPPGPGDLRGKYLAGGAVAKKDRSTWQIATAVSSGVIPCRHLERFLHSMEGNTTVKATDIYTLAREIQQLVKEREPYQATAARWAPVATAMRMSALFQATATTLGKPASAATGHDTPRLKVIEVSSIGLVDDSLCSSYPANAPNPQFTISEPVFSGIQPSLPPNEIGGFVHCYTWEGTFFMSWSWPQAFMGGVQELKAREGDVTVLDYIDRFVGVLERLVEGVKPDPA